MAAVPSDFGNGTIDPKTLLLHPEHWSQYRRPIAYSLEQSQRQIAWFHSRIDESGRPGDSSGDFHCSRSNQSINNSLSHADCLTAFNLDSGGQAVSTTSPYVQLPQFETDQCCDEGVSVSWVTPCSEHDTDLNYDTAHNQDDEGLLPHLDGNGWVPASTVIDIPTSTSQHENSMDLFIGEAPLPVGSHAESALATSLRAIDFANLSNYPPLEDCDAKIDSDECNKSCQSRPPQKDVYSSALAPSIEHYALRRLSAPTVPQSSRPIETSIVTGASNTRQRRWSEENHTSRSLEHNFIFVQEGKVVKAYSTTARGIRKGPLSHATRQSSKKCRQQKSVCIRCKKDHQPCHHDGDVSQPCSRCMQLGSTPSWSQPCTKAHFQDIVESGTCNYICQSSSDLQTQPVGVANKESAQRAINHLVVDGSRRIRIEIPENLNLDDLLSSIDHHQRNSNIRVSQADGSLFVLNLERCCRYVKKLRCKLQSSEHNLRKFIDCDILTAGKWEECVDECDPLADLMSCLSIWGNMPSRAKYSRLSRAEEGAIAAGAETPLDVEDAYDREVIIWAAQLSRIMCRKLEVDAYTHLQRVLNAWTSLSTDELKTFVHKLGLVLLTLRWRVSWWVLLGDGGTTPDPIGKEAYEHRVNSLCQVLYFYYCSMLRKLPSFTVKQELRGKMSTYADTSLPVFDDFPMKESIEGFEQWMKNGQELIKEAGVPGRLAGIGLRT